jgi:hypothetical protein
MRGRGDVASTHRAVNLFEQALVSANTLFLYIAAAQGLTVDALGHFTLAVTLALAVQSLTRAATGEVLVLRPSVHDDGHEAAAYIGAVMTLSVGGGVPVALVMAFATDDLAIGLLSGALAVAISLQDATRYFAIARKLICSLLLFSTSCTVIGIPVVFWLSTSTHDLTAVLSGAVSVSLAASVLFIVFTMRVAPTRADGGVRWIRRNFRLGSAFVVEVAIGAVVNAILPLVLARFDGPAAVAAFRITITVFGVTSVLINFSRATVGRDLAERVWSGERVELRAWAIKLTALFAVGIGATLLLLLVIPQHVASAVMGPVWADVHGMLWYGAADRFLACLSILPFIVARVHGVAWRGTAVRLAAGMTALAAAVPLIMALGARGALLAESLAYAITLIFLVRISRSATAAARC